jgi:hypothetical protein
MIKSLKQPLNFLQRVEGDKSFIGEEIEESKLIDYSNFSNKNLE